MSHGLPHRVRIGIAAGLALAFSVLAAWPAQAGQARQDEWWLRALHVTNAWEITRGSGVTIAVLDTGVDQAQPDLTGSVTTGPDYTNSGRTAGGPFWGIHGTEVASLIAGHGHGAGQADGILGVAPSAKILSVRVTLDSGDPKLGDPAIAGALPGGIARGIRWAVQHGATVIDLPLDPVTTAGAAGSGGSGAEQAAVRYALSKHVVLIAPAGDEVAGTNAVNYPAAYHGVIAVGAFDQHFAKAPFTSHQPYVTVTAAGVGVTAANPSSLAAADPSQAYAQLNSTSAASAIVAGIAALIRAQFPGLTPAQVTRALTTSTVYRPHRARNDGSGSGTVDAERALTAAAGIAEAVSSTAASGAAPSPPAQPAVHSSPIHRNIRNKLIMDAVIAGVVFLLLLGSIFAVRAWRRRHARSARLAEVRAATQVPARKPATTKKSTAKKTAKKRTAKKRAGKKGAPAGPPSPVAVGSQAPDTEAAPELQPAGFIPAPLSPAIPGSGAPTFGGAAAPTFTGSASPTFAGSGSTGFAGSPSTGFTGSSGFAGSSSPGFAAPSGFTGSARSGFAGPASPGSAGSASPGLAAAATPPSGPDAPAGIDSPSVPGSPGAPAADAAPPADAALPAGLVAPVDPASSASRESRSAAGANTPPWAPIPSDPRAMAKDAASAAIPDSAFPAPAAPAADTAGTGTPAAPGGAGQNLMGLRRAPTAVHRPTPPRTAQVSGRPPWEPAPQPDSELPWAQAPAPPRGGTGSLPTREQARPAQPSWETLAEDAWPGGPRGAALHPPVPPPADRNLGGLATRGSAAGAPAMRARPFSRPVPAAGLVPPRPGSPERARPAEEPPAHSWNPDAGVTPFRAAQPKPAPAAGGHDRPGAGFGDSPASASAASPASASAVSPASTSADPPASTRADAPASTPAASTASTQADTPTGTPAESAASTSAGIPASTSTDAAASEPAALLPRRLSTPPLRPPRPFPPSQPGTGSSLFRGTGQPSFPPAPRPATEPGAAGTWRPSAGPGPFPPASKPATDVPADDAPAGDSATGAPATDAAASSPEVPGTGNAQPVSGPPGAGTAGTGDSTGSFAAVDPGADQRSFPRRHPGDGDENFPASRPRTDADAFRLFPPLRDTGNDPPAPPATDGED